MKKIVSLILLLSLVLTFAVSCNNQTEPTGSSEPTTVPTVEPTTAPTEAPTTSAIIEPTIAEGTWGAAFWADFNAAVEANKGASADVIANTIYTSASGSAIGMGMVMPMEAGYFQGFSADVTGFKSAAVIAPMMSGTLLVYVFELEENASVREFVNFLNNNSDPGWMICMVAETTTIGANGNYVLAAYAPTNMPGNESSEAVIIEPVVDEGSKAEALWNEFVSYMDNFGATSLAEDVAYALTYGAAFTYGEGTVEALGMEVESDLFKYMIDGHDNAVIITCGDFTAYIFQLEMGMSSDSWGDWYLASNVVDGQQFVWGAYNETLIIMFNTEG